MKILRLKGEILDIYGFQQWLLKNNLGNNDKIGISWKIKKKRKLRTYRVTHTGRSYERDYQTEIILNKGTKSYKMGDLFGLPYMSFTSL
jgi:hypothetical protein